MAARWMYTWRPGPQWEPWAAAGMGTRTQGSQQEQPWEVKLPARKLLHLSQLRLVTSNQQDSL
jgi:hypothetical protein